MPNKDRNIPKRRFKAFENADAWELRRFSELAEIRRGLTYSPTSIRKEGIRVLRSSNIDEDTFTFGEDDVFVDKGVVKIPLVKEGDILITAANGSSRLVGKHTIIKGLPANSTVHGGFMLLASCRNPEFVNSLMSSEWYNKFISLYVAGGNGAIGNLNKNDLDNQLVVVPSTSEQSAIGTFFSTLDQQITLHQRKLDKLKHVKQAYLSEMFPAEGERMPKRRFPGFTDAWELQKLGEVGAVAMCRRIFKEQTSEIGEIPFYKIGTFGGTPDAFISKELFEEYRNKYPYPTKGDILISASGSIGRTVEFLGKDEYFQDSNIVWLKHDGKIDNIFLKQFYSIVKWSGVEGSTIKRLYNENILNTEIALPSLLEQKAIGTFFSTLDRQITLHQRKLEKLKNLKKALLNELFV
ncbi:restriction endonuclease subunit S [Streptococcus suis]|uniref:restriction endonuclease subunit S n=1 Tax=Streptococcus suis TaxID=1307 RepID=UPI00300FE974